MPRLLHPNISIQLPPGARTPDIPSPIKSWSPYLNGPNTPQDAPFRPYAEVDSLRPPPVPKRKSSRTLSISTTASPVLEEPPLVLDVRPGHSPYPSSVRTHRSTRSEAPTLPSPRSSLDYSFESTTSFTVPSLTEQLSNLSVDTDENIRKFQANLLPPNEEEWHLLVPAETREALGKEEVQRQSVIFEIIKSEKGYVSDMELVREVFIGGLRTYNPPVMDKERIRGFIQEVFWNLDEVIANHKRMLGQLFDRQKDQHPVVLSIADILLDACLQFRDEYESYIKHYPLAEARHRAELKRNADYHYFMVQVGQDPRVRKHDLATFLNRPVSRLPRLSLLLEHLLKLSDAEHPDRDSLPLTLDILSDVLRSTQPGIDAAGSRAKFWEVAETLSFSRGEIIDMDLYDEKRTLVHAGVLARRDRDWCGWTEHFVALLDNYLILTREEARTDSDSVKRHVVSRPIPLEYLRVAEIHAAPQIRRERSESAGLLSFRGEARPAFPITFWHESNVTSRRYTFYAASESMRDRWQSVLLDAIVVRRTDQEANMWFAPHSINDGFFQHPGLGVPEQARLQYTGKITCATSFVAEGQQFVIVGTLFGIYIAHKAMPNYQKVLTMMSPTSISAISQFDKLVIHQRNSVYSCSLSALARFTRAGPQGQREIDASFKRITGVSEHVLFSKVGRVGDRTLIFYATKGMLQTSLQTLEIVDMQGQLKARRNSSATSEFRTFGESVNVPKDVRKMSCLDKNIAICGEKGMLVMNPTKLQTAMTVVPDFRQSSANAAMSELKTRCDSACPLGLIKCYGGSELMAVYDELACYVDKHGVPTRRSACIRWETKADSFVRRGNHILLFSSGFVEIREVSTGRLVQVLEGQDIRLLHSCEQVGDDVLVAMRRADSTNGPVQREKVVELLQTAEIAMGPVPVGGQEYWDEWDMAGG